MYQINDLIIYGKSGVCKVEGIGQPNIAGINQEKQYYILKPVYSKGGVIYTPVDNMKVQLRSIISEEDAEDLIQSIPDILVFEDYNDKMVEEKYKEAINTQECKELVRIIKTIYEKEEAKSKEGKKIGQIDERYKKQAEELLYSELAIVLDMDREVVKEYIEDRIVKLEQR